MAARGIFDAERFVTSEAVEIELPAAQVPIRMVSGFIDLLVTAAVAAGIVYLLPVRTILSDPALFQAIVIVGMVVIMVGLPITLETLTRGRTLGKMVMGLRTVRDDTGPIGLRHAVIRALAGTVELWASVGSIALLVALTNERAKRLGDFLAGTYVVRDRVRLRLPDPPQAPAELADWSASADIGVLPDALVVATRQFLARADTLTPSARAQTGTDLYTALLRYVAPPPPGGAHPEHVMAAILVQRRRRDEERLARADALRARLLPDAR